MGVYNIYSRGQEEIINCIIKKLKARERFSCFPKQKNGQVNNDLCPCLLQSLTFYFELSILTSRGLAQSLVLIHATWVNRCLIRSFVVPSNNKSEMQVFRETARTIYQVKKIVWETLAARCCVILSSSWPAAMVRKLHYPVLNVLRLNSYLESKWQCLVPFAFTFLGKYCLAIEVLGGRVFLFNCFLFCFPLPVCVRLINQLCWYRLLSMLCVFVNNT